MACRAVKEGPFTTFLVLTVHTNEKYPENSELSHSRDLERGTKADSQQLFKLLPLFFHLHFCQGARALSFYFIY